jgi:hypothetical protein
MPAAAYSEVNEYISAINDRRKQLILVEFLKSYLLYRMLGLGNRLKVYDVQEVPIYTSPPVLGTWINKGDVLPEGHRGQKVMGYWNNRYVVVPTTFDLLENMQREGDPARMWDDMDLLEVETSWALRRTLCSAAWNGTGGKMPDGISYAIEKRAPSAQTSVITGINKATKTYWRNNYVQLTTNAGYIAPGTQLPAIFIALLTLIQNCTIGSNSPSDLIADRATFNLMKRAMLETSTPYHLMTKTEDAKFGFEHFLFDGKYLAWDPSCPADSIYALALSDDFEQWRLNNPNDKAMMDRDLDEVGANKFMDLDGNTALLFHPNIQRRNIEPRTGLRTMVSTKWIIDSFNLGWKSMARHGVLGSDNGSRLSTWS